MSRFSRAGGSDSPSRLPPHASLCACSMAFKYVIVSSRRRVSRRTRPTQLKLWPTSAQVAPSRNRNSNRNSCLFLPNGRERCVCGGADEWTVSVSSSSSLCALGRKRNGKTRGCARCSLFPHALFLSLKSSWRNLYVFSIKVDIMLLRFIERTNELGNGQQ